MASNKRKLNRRDFTYYMQVKDEATKRIIGYLSDISTGEFPRGKNSFLVFHLCILYIYNTAHHNACIRGCLLVGVSDYIVK